MLRADVYNPAFSPDGQRVLAGFAGFETNAAGIALYDIDGAYQASVIPNAMCMNGTTPSGVSVGDAVDWWLQA